jgi:hypothetical protein
LATRLKYAAAEIAIRPGTTDVGLGVAAGIITRRRLVRRLPRAIYPILEGFAVTPVF